MTQIYFVETKVQEQRDLLCRWVERLYDDGKKVQVVVDSTVAAQHLDQLLWTFSQESFIPHRIDSAKGPKPGIEPVVITVGEVELEGFDVLVCDAPIHLDFMGLYPAAIHFVLLDDEDKRQESRLMWQKARDRGFKAHHASYGGTAKVPNVRIS